MVVLNEGVQFVGEGRDHMEVWDGQQMRGLLLHPLRAAEPLATWTMTIAARVWREVFLAAMSTLVLMATQRRCATGGDGAKNLPVMGRQTMSLGEVG